MAVNSKKWIIENRHKFERIIGKTVSIKLNGISVVRAELLNTIQPTKLTDLENAPEKRQGDTEKMYTPPCFSLLFGNNTLVFAIEDTDIRPTINNGVRLTVGCNVVELEAVYENNHIA